MDRDVGSQLASAEATIPSEVARDDRFALVVGIDRYPGFTDLNGACHDAGAFAAWLADPSGGDVPAENTRLLLGDQPVGLDVARPVKAQIDTALHEFVERVKRTRAPARLYLFFAGHGVAADLGTGSMLMADARPGLCWNISLGAYRRWLDRCRDFSEVVIICDACRSLAIEVPEGMPPHDTCPEPFPHPQRSFVALATDLGGRAYESPAGGGFFTARVLDGLRSAAAHRVTGEINSATLAEFLESNRPLDAASTQRVHTVIEGGTLSFGSKQIVSFDVTVEVATGSVRPVRIIRDVDHVVVSEHRGPGPWIVRLERGLYEFEDPAGAPAMFKVAGPGTRVGG